MVKSGLEYPHIKYPQIGKLANTGKIKIDPRVKNKPLISSNTKNVIPNCTNPATVPRIPKLFLIS
jgi:hypothetical protein